MRVYLKPHPCDPQKIEASWPSNSFAISARLLLALKFSTLTVHWIHQGQLGSSAGHQTGISDLDRYGVGAESFFFFFKFPDALAAPVSGDDSLTV